MEADTPRDGFPRRKRSIAFTHLARNVREKCSMRLELWRSRSGYLQNSCMFRMRTQPLAERDGLRATLQVASPISSPRHRLSTRISYCRRRCPLWQVAPPEKQPILSNCGRARRCCLPASRRDDLKASPDAQASAATDELPITGHIPLPKRRPIPR
jgi:hypothetical protein